MESLFAALSQEYLRSGVRCDTPTNFQDAKMLHNGFSDFESWLTWNHDGSWYLRFRNDNECNSVRLRVRGNKPSRPESTARIFVNGEEVAALNPDGTSGGSEILVDLPLQLESLGDMADVVIEIRAIDQNAGSFAQVFGVEFGKSAMSR